MASTTPQPRTPSLHGIKPLSQVQEESVSWLWYPYVPAGKLSVLEGDPGLGKSWITCSIAARVSRGETLPGQSVPLPPQRVLMLSAEDGLGDTVKPRIMKLGGDLDKIFVSDEFFILDPRGIKDLEYMMEQVAATLVFIDPIVAYMGGKIDMNKANEVRTLMEALKAAAGRTGSAIMAIRHLRKAGGGAAIYRGLGSIDFTAAARSVMQVHEDKDGVRYMDHVKHNLSPKGRSLSYTLENDGVFEWEDVYVDQGVTTSNTRAQKAKDFLFDTLRDGERPGTEVLSLAKEAGIATATLNRARRGLVQVRKDKERWYWSLRERQEKVDG